MSVSNISKRLDKIENQLKDSSNTETDLEIGSRFAKLRRARAKKTNALGEKTYEDVYNNITKEELDYYKRKNLQVPPEQRYQTQKEDWYFHESSWYYRGEERYDRNGYNKGECDPECRFYPEEGRIEDEEVLSWYDQ